MQKSELVNDLKKMIGPAVETDDSGLTVWLNDAYMYMVDAVTKENPDFFAKSATTSSFSGQQEYTLPTDQERVLMVNIQINGVWQRVRPLPNINFVPIIQRTDTSQGYTWSDPVYYIYGGKIGFLPIPAETTSNNIKVWYVYTPTEMTNDSDTPALPKKYHHIIKYGAYATYMDQDDEHVAAERMRQRFESRVADMVESLTQSQIDESKSVEVTSNTDMYQDCDRYYSP